MIDRGALVLERPEGGGYRGVHRRPLDAMPFTGRKGKDIGRRYTAGVIAGEGVLEDLDDAIELCAEATKIGLAVEVVVFEVPRQPAAPGGLEVVGPAPAEGLRLLGWEVFEAMEPWWSLLTHTAATDDDPKRNAQGLFASRREAERFLDAHRSETETDEPLVVGRIWVVEG